MNPELVVTDPDQQEQSVPVVKAVKDETNQQCPEVKVSPSRQRHHSGQELSQSRRRDHLNLPLSSGGDNDLYRSRSGSFNPTILTSSKDNLVNDSEKWTMSRERSFTDLNQQDAMMAAAARQYATLPKRLRRPSVIFNDEDTQNNMSSSGSENSLYDETDLEVVQCFLPTGLVIDISIHPDDELVQIKQIILSSATSDEQLPLRGCLNPDADAYSVIYVSQNGRKEEVIDETKTYRELKPFLNILKFVKRNRDRTQYQFKQRVGQLIGKDLRDFDKLRSCEVNDFRWRMKVFANRLAQERRSRLKQSWKDRIMYQYPPRLVLNSIGSQSKFKDNLIIADIKWGSYEAKCIEIPADSTAEEVVKALAKNWGINLDQAEQCCIKTIGEASFLLGGHKLSDYAFLHESPVPKLLVINKDDVEIERAPEKIYISLEVESAGGRPCPPTPTPTTPSLAAPPPAPVILTSPRSPRKPSLTTMSLGTLAASSPFQFNASSTSIERMFSLKIEGIKMGSDFYHNGMLSRLGLQAGLFHGGKLLCRNETVALRMPNTDEVKDGLLHMDLTMHFDMKVSNLPRMTKLCLGIYEKKKSAMHPISWVNANVFDYQAKLRKRDTLHTWKYFLGDVMPTYEMLSPLRHSISHSNTREATGILVCLDAEAEHPQQKVEFPAKLTTKHITNNFMEASNGNGHSNYQTLHPQQSFERLTKMYGEELQNISSRDPLHEITVQEKDLLWKMREYCLINLPGLLPRIIDCVNYSNLGQVAELHHLLERWPLLAPEDSLHLLDYAYPDEHVRGFAVKCLRTASDDKIRCYLLQLAQALKHESYLQCDLVEFLLERALNNQHIGHHLFWELKAEMASPSVGLLYGLVLETYLTAAPEHLKILAHQTTLLEKCKTNHTNLQKMEVTTKSFEKARNRFAASTRNQFFGHHPYRNFVSPLNPSMKCKRILMDKCQLMNSKMRPQMLFFENADVNFSRDLADIVIMFKRGDDLRQDRLTLQLLTVMDRLWKEDSGLDFRLNVYRCVSTDAKEGFIEVVTNAETVCKIQMKQAASEKLFLKSTAALRKGLIMSWLRSHNSTTQDLRKAQYEFTMSCAGYSVATYILGIADRHNDNIMVRTNGQLFHIDFGHFLGNFKHKFGIKRERVPMVLPAEFVEVIREDLSEEGSANNFEHFRGLCEQAFLTIRRRSNLILSLLTMMISTGLPELTSEHDLNIVRTTLHLDAASEADAIEGFRKDFNESLRNAWTISLNWWVHLVNQWKTG